MLQIQAGTNEVLIDGKATGLGQVQRLNGTVVYTMENLTRGVKYAQHQMPQQRYSTAHETPTSGSAGRLQLEADLRALIAQAPMHI